MRQLCNNRDVVFKKADKESVTVIINEVRHLPEDYRQLNNSFHYKKLNAVNREADVNFSEI